MALHPDHPAAIRRRKNDKSERLKKLYDVNQYSEPFSAVNGCGACTYWSECIANLWRWEATEDGIKYAPLRCFAEHPEYNPDEWRMRS